MHAFTVMLTDLNCGDSSKGIMFISNVRRPWHWMLRRGAISSRLRRCCRVVCCCWKAMMAGNVVSIPKIMAHVLYSLRIQFILNWPCARGFSVFCVWGEERNGYYAFVWSVSTWLAHDMFEAILDFSTSWTVELSSLPRIFSIWCFHQSYSMIMCGFHHVMHAQMKNNKLWLRDAIEHEMVELILWNLMAKHQRRLRMGLTLHPTYSSLKWRSPR